MKRPWLRALGLVAVLAITAAACSETETDEGADGGGSETTEATEPSTRTTRGVTDDSIKVGGVQWSALGNAGLGAEARFARANAEGGVNGRQIEFVGSTDDGNVRETNLATVDKLVKQDEVFAVLPVVTGNFGGVDTLISENVPFFGWGIDPGFCGNEVGFGVTGCVTDPDLEVGSNALGTALAEYYDGDTDKTVALIAEDSDTGRGGLVLLTQSMIDLGFDAVYSEAVVPSPPTPVADWSPFVNALLTSDDGSAPDIILYTLSRDNSLGLANALGPQLPEGTLQITPLYSPLLSSAPFLQGSLVVTQFTPYDQAAQQPALQQAIDDISAIRPDFPRDIGTFFGYFAADMFLKMLEATGEDVTVERFLQAANGFEYEVPGVIGPSSWPENHDRPVPCASLSQVENEQYVTAVPLVCGENITVEN